MMLGQSAKAWRAHECRTLVPPSSPKTSLPASRLLVRSVVKRSFASPQPAATASATSTSLQSSIGNGQRLDQHIPINMNYPGLQQLHTSPDIYLVKSFLDDAHCDSIISNAVSKGLEDSPVAYAGWTRDAAELLRMAALGPAVWLSFPTANAALNAGGPIAQVARQIMGAWAEAMLLCGTCIAGWLAYQQQQLKKMRTSTSVLLPGDDKGSREFVARSEDLLQSHCSTFEAPTVIHYDEGQVLSPHYDANREAVVEDANRGGQTLATLILYLNEVTKGGRTAFGKLGLSVEPQKGDCLLFFPATAAGEFDERTEHEGETAVQEKWICRIWKHQNQVNPPMGLPADFQATSEWRRTSQTG
mmetsp:Transcript_8805/g.32461  ORF Transcript_8805/g.32461 Transcript_8805/m.32461 type:complete len:359 (-) Transcript_8805:835-1911(-)